MNPTDHATKRAKLVQEIAELGEPCPPDNIRVAGRNEDFFVSFDGLYFRNGARELSNHAYEVAQGVHVALRDVTVVELCRLRDNMLAYIEAKNKRAELQAQLTALDATPVYPSVTFIDPKTRTQNYVTFRDGAFYVGGGSRPWYTAVELAYHLVEVEKLDEFVLRLLALKGAAASVEPSWWVNVERGFKWGYAYSTEAIAREQHNVRNAERIAVPVYEHPPTPVAYQKVGACVTAGDGYMTWTYGTRQVANAREWAAQHGGAAHVLYAGEEITTPSARTGEALT